MKTWILNWGHDLFLLRFYSGDSSFVHGGLEKDDKTLEPVSNIIVFFATFFQNQPKWRQIEFFFGSGIILLESI